MITYYSIIQCLNIARIYDILSIYYIGLYQNKPSLMILSCLRIILFMLVYRRKHWAVLHILMKYLTRLIFGIVMMNLFMKDQDGQS